jgi:hypothetical protein
VTAAPIASTVVLLTHGGGAKLMEGNEVTLRLLVIEMMQAGTVEQPFVRLTFKLAYSEQETTLTIRVQFEGTMEQTVQKGGERLAEVLRRLAELAQAPLLPPAG